MSIHPLLKSLGVMLCSFAAASPALAQDQLDRPYDLQIVLHLSRHPVLTDVLRDQLERELGDTLQAALGTLAQVKVVRGHDALELIRTKGLQKGLDGWRERSDVKTHFVLVDYVDTYYQIQARQYDGWVGQPGPVVRRAQTRDRAYVARTATLLIQRDFGLAGIVEGETNTRDVVRVRLRGGPGVRFGEHVARGEVFALVQASDETGATELVPWTVLQVIEPPGKPDGPNVCTCRLASRYELGPIAGYRCFKLGTQRGPLRIRLMKRYPGGQLLHPLEDTHQIQAGKSGFRDDQPLVGNTDKQDAFSTASRGSAGLFDHVAFVTVMQGDVIRAPVPVALLNDDLVIIPLSPATPQEESKRLIKESWIRAVADAYLRQTVRFQQLNVLAGDPNRREEALTHARETLERTRSDLTQLTRDRRQIQDSSPTLSAADARLQQIREGADELTTFMARLEEIERKENDPRRKQALAQLERATLLEREGEIAEAIKLLEAVPPDIGGAALAERLKKLKDLWAPKNPQHAQAREFIYNTWPGLDTPELKEKLDEGRKAFEACRQVNDLLGAKKLLDGTLIHGDRLRKEVDQLKPNINPEDEKPARLIEELAPELGRLAADIDTFLKKATPP